MVGCLSLFSSQLPHADVLYGRLIMVLGRVIVRPYGALGQFSRDGRIVAWGDLEGTVSVCDLVEVQRQLAEVGLG